MLQKLRLVSFLLILFLLSSSSIYAQELNVEVKILTPKAFTTDPQQIKDMEQAIKEFMNNQKWTDHVFEVDERIECSFQFTITEELAINNFLMDIAIQAVRPVYGSDYKTPIFNYVDKSVVVRYEPTMPLENSRQLYRNNLSSVLSYYAYLILGLDYDTFSPYGGDLYLQMSQTIVNLIPPNVSEMDKGWSGATNNRNRYFLIENILNPRARVYRQAMYDYHRQGLDLASEDMASSRANILKAMESLDRMASNFPNAMILIVIAATKGNELIEVFKPAPRIDRIKVYNYLSKLDPANRNRWEVLRS
jgi:hypothetical protein